MKKVRELHPKPGSSKLDDGAVMATTKSTKHISTTRVLKANTNQDMSIYLSSRLVIEEAADVDSKADGLPLQLRYYQQEIVNYARDSNTIAFVPTGSGKTLIACHLIGSRLKLLRSADNGMKKLIAFVAPTKVLLGQQLTYIAKHCGIEFLKVREFNGDAYYKNKKIEFWREEEWNESLKDCEVCTQLCVIHFLPDARV